MGLNTALSSLIGVSTMLGARIRCANVTGICSASARRVILCRLGRGATGLLTSCCDTSRLDHIDLTSKGLLALL